VNPSTHLARLAVDALARAGVGHVVLCPGSRSAPLAYELQRRDGDGLCLHVRHDERVAAFTALGVGLDGALGAVVTTSGTAAANLHPAVLEAHHARRPLVVVTADRPVELRGTWANQTSELQAGLFGDAVRARLDLPDATATADPALAARSLAATLAAARGPLPGPVHLDLGFTDPLVPDDDEPGRWAMAWADTPQPAPPPPARLADGPRAVVVAGDGAGAGARELAVAAHWPLLAEPTSGAAGADGVAAYRLLLELPELGGRVERAVVFGRPTLSRPVTRLLSRPDVELVLVSSSGSWQQPGRAARRVGVPDPADHRYPADDWSAAWEAASMAAGKALDAVLDEPAPAITGPAVARAVARTTVPPQRLVAAASNPIRDLDLVGSALAGGVRVFANRGLAGIDGTVSTATGLALAGGPVRVLVGDLAFLHDLNGLLVPPGEARADMQVVVLNDDGGGIFSLLEHGERALHGPERAAAFERIFGTPHGADLGALCAGYGVPHRRVPTLEELEQALALPLDGVSVVEVPAGRGGLRELHARIRAAVSSAARAALS
jgi:2-succinyl-5-enolpyruvyl-6-hydroxy-3-cyclohexene-1-carboxylate synthase